MSSEPAIRVERLGKRYRLGASQRAYSTLREKLTSAVLAPVRRAAAVLRGQSTIVSRETIWALRDVSIEIDRGEVIGVIGRNGAGKTTLLKILSRITEPTEGRAEIYGRVGSLLEVGTGFHPELTGRENIYLNGAILGMKRVEIDRKFDEIVAFAEVERFIDTQVKHYSSGMFLRLAFAVAAHLDPDILLIDEVLAVGDQAFQKKCLEKVGEITGEGRTVLFVSHNLYAVQALCKSVLWMDQGGIRELGETGRVTASYRLEVAKSGAQSAERDDKDTDIAAIQSIAVNGVQSRYVDLHDPSTLRVEWDFEIRKSSRISLGVSLSTADGVYVSGLATGLEGRTFGLEPGVYSTALEIPNLKLASGVYVLRINLMNEDGSSSFSYRSPAATLYVESPFRFDGILSTDHVWEPPTIAGR